MPTLLAEKAPYWKPTSLSSVREMGRMTVLGCGDDRWQWGGIQFFGGSIGFAAVWAGGMELRKPGSFSSATSTLKQPVDTLARVINQTLQYDGIDVLGLNHKGCAAFMGLKPIARTGLMYRSMDRDLKVVTGRKREQALAIAQTITDISVGRFDAAAEALARVAKKAVRATATAEKAMKPSGNYRWVESDSGLVIPTSDKGIPMVPLQKPRHEADLVAVSGDPNHRFDSMAAWEAGSKAYHVSMGHLPQIHEVVSPFVGDPGLENLQDVVAVFTAKTVLNLPHPEGGNLGPDNVQYLPQVQHLA